MLTGPDVSHYQGNVNWRAVLAAGHSFGILKATEGTGFTDGMLKTNRANAQAAGIGALGFYHFARTGSPQAEADYFLSKIGALAANEFTCLDWEISPGGDVVAWCAAFCDRVKERTGRWPLIYMNGPRITRDNWAPLVRRGVQLWLAGNGTAAAYDNNPKFVNVKWWGAPTLKQYTESGSVPGVGGGCDVNVLFGNDLKALTQGASNPPPQEEDDMAKFKAFRSDPEQGTGDSKGTGAMALAAPGLWYSVPSIDYWNLLLARGVTENYINVPHNEFLYFQALYQLNEVNDNESVERLKDLEEQVSGNTTSVDPAALAAALAAAIPAHLAEDVADELGRRIHVSDKA
jgi:GH25 family lysozyme M1 (1,4-beta-N-acetylmuramidase)